MKNIKRIISMVLTLTMLCLTTVPAFANESNFKNINVINEYDNYISLVSKSDSQLKASGMTNEDINYIRNFNYEEEVRNRAKLSDETLKTYGYTKNEIKELRSVAEMDNISTDALMSISTSTLTSYIQISKKGTITEGGSTVRYVDLFYKFKWSKIPLFTLVDMVAIGFHSDSSTEYVYKQVSNHTFKAYFKTLLTGAETQETINWNYKVDNKIPSVSAKFAIGVKNSNSELTKFCFYGSGTFRITNRDTTARLYVDAAYGHTTINIVPTYSISLTNKKVDIGIKFAVGMDSQHNRGYYYSNLTIDNSYIYEGDVRP